VNRRLNSLRPPLRAGCLAPRRDAFFKNATHQTARDRTKWDLRSFGALIVERHGQPAGVVVEDLLVWASRKQGELRYSKDFDRN